MPFSIKSTIELFKKALFLFSLPPKWQIPFSLLFAIIIGIIFFILYISNPLSYLFDDPKTCINCHVMIPQYTDLKHSSHREYATCNDCHVPQDGIFKKYFFKIIDGARHSTIYTFFAEDQVIKISDIGKEIVQENCKRCHEFLVQNIKNLMVMAEDAKLGQGKLCWNCHREAPHGRVNSLSSVPNAGSQIISSNVPYWIKKTLNKEK